MNERYQGDGPQGKTRKSAAKLKPVSEAASSVNVEKKPTTKQERKAARKKRDAQIAAKEKERQRKAEEREKQALLESGEEPEKPPKVSLWQRFKKFMLSSPKDEARPARGKGPDTPEYRRYKRIYWTFMIVGVIAIAIAFMINFNFPELLGGWGMMMPMAIAYATVISAIILDFTKIRKLQKAYMDGSDPNKQSPKQLKHAQQKAEAAALLEESKKAQKELKRANSKIPFRRRGADGSSEDEGDSASEGESSSVGDEPPPGSDDFE